MKVLLISSDLMLVSAMHGMAGRDGVESIAVGSADESLAACQGGGVQAAILDLRTSGLDAETLVPELRAAMGPGGRVVAFAPHVHEQSLAAARNAGCDDVFTRGQFDVRVATLLKGISSSAG
jgi:DNA-binding response OmpR family regulator